MNTLYYGDNLPNLRKLDANIVDLCYIDPPFNSNSNYNQICNNIVKKDEAQVRVFTDTWEWGKSAIDGFEQITTNYNKIFTTKTIELMIALKEYILKDGGMLAYLTSMTLRLAEIHRILKSNGNFLLHCNFIANSYLKLILDSIFIPRGGKFLNELIWHKTSGGGWSRSSFVRKHDTILYYSKSNKYTFNTDENRVPYKESSGYAKSGITSKSGKHYSPNPKGKPQDDVIDTPIVNPMAKDRRNDTQKPLPLLEIFIKSCSNVGDTVLDAYMGSGTTIIKAEELNRKWIGMDITYTQIKTTLKRLEDCFRDSSKKNEILNNIRIIGIPKDMESAKALSLLILDNGKKDNAKEFEKWAIGEYTNGRGIGNEKKGADGGIDGRSYFMTEENKHSKIIYSVKSGGVDVNDIGVLISKIEPECASMGVFITYEKPTKPMVTEATKVGTYKHGGFSYPIITIVTIQEILNGVKTKISLLAENISKKAPQINIDKQNEIEFEVKNNNKRK